MHDLESKPVMPTGMKDIIRIIRIKLQEMARIKTKSVKIRRKFSCKKQIIEKISCECLRLEKCDRQIFYGVKTTLQKHPKNAQALRLLRKHMSSLLPTVTYSALMIHSKP